MSLFFHRPLPDLPAGQTQQAMNAVKAGAFRSEGAVRMQVPSGWTFAHYSHSPALLSHINVPGMGRVTMGPQRDVILAAKRDQGSCTVILERGRSESANPEEDVASIKHTVSQNVYERHILDWVSSGPAWFGLLVNTADEILNQPGPAKRTIDFKQTNDSVVHLGTLPARMVGFSANVDGRESDFVFFAFARQYQQQLAMIAGVGEPPRQCLVEVMWIQSRLSFD
jgi:hypothetical protein